MIYTNLTSTPFMQSGSALLTASAMPKPYPVQEISASGNKFWIGIPGTSNPGTVPIMIGGLQWNGAGGVSADYYSGEVTYGDGTDSYVRSLTDQELYDLGRGAAMCFTPTPYGHSYYVRIKSLALWFNITGSPSSVSFYIPTQYDTRNTKRSFWVDQTIVYRGLANQIASSTESVVPYTEYWQTPGSAVSALAHFART